MKLLNSFSGLALVLLLASTSLADLQVMVRDAVTVETITPTITTQLQTVDGDLIGEPVTTTGEPTTKPGKPAVLLLLASDRDLSDRNNVLVRIKCKTAAAVEIGPASYLISEAGKHSITVVVLAQNPLSWDEAELTVVVGEPEPEPEPDPPPKPEPDPIPDTPEDRFDNIGQRVAVWSQGIPGGQAVAALYRNHAGLLRADPSQTINSVSDSLMRSLSSVTAIERFTEVRKKVSADLTQRWSRDGLGRVDLADYYDAVATGLEASR